MAAFSEGFLEALRSGIWLSKETAAKNWEIGKKFAKDSGKTELEVAEGLAEASYYQGFLEALEWLLHGERVGELKNVAQTVSDSNIVPPHQRN